MTDPPVTVSSPREVLRIGEFFKACGYTGQNFAKTLGSAEVPSTVLGNVPPMLERTAEPTALNALLRWFWIGVPQESPRQTPSDANCLPEWFLEQTIACNLLRKQGKDLIADVMVFPMEELLLVCDKSSRFEAGQADVVLWPNPTSWLVSNFMAKRQARRALDLGTGTGVHAILAASHSEHVVATDVNERALAFAAFNALLNGRTSVECLASDGFANVPGGGFDLIVCNPPFFMGPSQQYLFCDNPMELDGFCRQLVRQAGPRLAEGGLFQMLCEWPEIQGQPWRERLAEWFAGSGCDAWVMKTLTRDPVKYAKDRADEQSWLPSPSGHLAEHVAYYRQKGLTAIHDGIVVMRRRSGRNWMALEELPAPLPIPPYPFGDFILSGFVARDFLCANPSAEDMLALRPAISPNARLDQVYTRGTAGWETASFTLSLRRGYPLPLPVKPLAIELLSGCDGRSTLAEVIARLAPRVNVPRERLEKECLEIMPALIAQGLALIAS